LPKVDTYSQKINIFRQKLITYSPKVDMIRFIYHSDIIYYN